LVFHFSLLFEGLKCKFSRRNYFGCLLKALYSRLGAFLSPLNGSQHGGASSSGRELLRGAKSTNGGKSAERIDSVYLRGNLGRMLFFRHDAMSAAQSSGRELLQWSVVLFTKTCTGPSGCVKQADPLIDTQRES